MKMSLWDMDALKGVPTQNKQHAKKRQSAWVRASARTFNPIIAEFRISSVSGLKPGPT
jgi:hypothetical protein